MFKNFQKNRKSSCPHITNDNTSMTLKWVCTLVVRYPSNVTKVPFEQHTSSPFRLL